MINWKSNTAFFLFIGAYLWSIITTQQSDVLEVTGTLAYLSAVAMMLRSDTLATVVTNLSERFKK